MNNNSSTKPIKEYISGIYRQKNKLFVTFVIVFSIVSAIAILLPPVYESKATILIKQQAIPENFVKSTVTSYADQRIKVISQRAMTRDNLTKIIDKYNLYAEDRKKKPIEEIIENMKDDIKVDTVNANVVDPSSGRVTIATIAFTISFKNKSPDIAQKVANELVSLYLNENIKNRTQKALETSGFMSEEAEKINKQIETLEKNLASFKEKNAGTLPAMYASNFQMFESAQNDVGDVDRQLSLLKEKKVYLESQLSHVEPYLYDSSTGMSVSPEQQIKRLEARKVMLSSMYRSDHPDIKRVNQQLAKLEKNVGVEDTAFIHEQLTNAQKDYQKLKQLYTDDNPDVERAKSKVNRLEESLKNDKPSAGDTKDGFEPDNPLYIKIKTDLETLKLQERSLERQKQDDSKKLALYEKRLRESPEVERKFSDLGRNYDNAMAKYRDLRAKQLEAQIAESLELDRKAERFVLIEPPLAPEKPKSPNRILIVSVGLIFAIIAGFAVAVIFDTMDGAIYTERQLAFTIGAPALAIIPVIYTKTDKMKQKFKLLTMIGGVILFISFSLLSINEWYKPLDVLWFVILRKLDVA